MGNLYERAVVTATSAEERFRLYAGGRELGEIVRKPDGDQILFFHADHLGSVDTISNHPTPLFSA